MSFPIPQTISFCDSNDNMKTVVSYSCVRYKSAIPLHLYVIKFNAGSIIFFSCIFFCGFNMFIFCPQLAESHYKWCADDWPDILWKIYYRTKYNFWLFWTNGQFPMSFIWIRTKPMYHPLQFNGLARTRIRYRLMYTYEKERKENQKKTYTENESNMFRKIRVQIAVRYPILWLNFCWRMNKFSFSKHVCKCHHLTGYWTIYLNDVKRAFVTKTFSVFMIYWCISESVCRYVCAHKLYNRQIPMNTQLK